MTASLFLSVIFGLIAGVALASFKVSVYFFCFLFLIFIFRRHLFKNNLLFIIFALLGFWRYEFYETKSLNLSLTNYNGHKVILYGVVSEEIDPGGNYQKVIIKTIKVNNNLREGLVLVTLAKYPELFYGDILEISGNLEPPSNWSDFRYDRYLARYDIYSLMAFPKIKIINQSADFYANLLKLKKRVYLIVNSALPEPEAGLANALLLGYKRTLDTPEKTAFSCCGLSHIVAISGSHLTLLAILAFDFLLLFGLSRRRSFKPVISFLWLYTFFTGLQSSAVRSAIMGSLTLWGESNGRHNSGGRLLFSAAAIMLFINPLLLRDDLGFQLSFLAMVALIYIYPLGQKIWGQGSIKNIIILTLAVQILTWPISALNFGSFSLIAPLANLLVTWIFIILLPALLFATALSFILPSFCVLWFTPAYFMLRYINIMGSWLAAVPYACLNLEISWQFMIIYYLILFSLYFISVKKIQKSRRR